MFVLQRFNSRKMVCWARREQKKKKKKEMRYFANKNLINDV